MDDGVLWEAVRLPGPAGSGRGRTRERVIEGTGRRERVYERGLAASIGERLCQLPTSNLVGLSVGLPSVTDNPPIYLPASVV